MTPIELRRRLTEMSTRMSKCLGYGANADEYDKVIYDCKEWSRRKMDKVLIPQIMKKANRHYKTLLKFERMYNNK